MPSFAYLARDAGGGKAEGVLDAPDAQSLAERLAAQGLLLVRADAQTEGSEDVLAGLRKRLRGSKVTLPELLFFCRQMATLLKAGVPMLRALGALQESATSRGLGAALADITKQLESGRELSTAMRNHPQVFGDYMVSMIRVGEATGRLPDVFNGLYAQISFTRDSREQVATALRYPSFVVAITFAALIAINLFVIPTFAKVYKSLKADLPFITQMLIGISEFALAWWPLVLALAIGAIGAVGSALRTPGGRKAWDGLLLKLPVIGALVHKAALARFSRSFALALEAGVPVVDALQVATDTTDNAVLAERIGEMRYAAERGESLARAARATGVFTTTILQMIAVGEETGQLGEMLDEVAGAYQREVDYAVKTLAAQIEPILVIVLGAVILVFALGVFLPLWDLSRVALR